MAEIARKWGGDPEHLLTWIDPPSSASTPPKLIRHLKLFDQPHGRGFINPRSHKSRCDGSTRHPVIPLMAEILHQLIW